MQVPLFCQELKHLSMNVKFDLDVNHPYTYTILITTKTQPCWKLDVSLIRLTTIGKTVRITLDCLDV